ncbi:protein of unknown function [Methylorubrum extorquens]|uniref:Uncharacterized protein n=1 Tax=Methylorubrum extorquens TaxID=408 RepID=A0A2N9AL03_METEX|nr:protein of unknown function [Methylorubrum extorquens]
MCLDRDPAAARLREGVVQGVRRQFVDQQRQRGGHGGGERQRLDLRLDPGAVPVEAGGEVCDQVGGELPEVEAGDVALRVQHPVGRGEGADPVGHGLERVAGVALRRAAGLQQHQRRDDLEVVLDPMIDLVEQRGLLFQGRAQVGGPLAHLALQRVVGVAHRQFQAVLVGHVGLGREEEQDLARLVADGIDRHAVPERRAVLAVIEQLALERPARGESRPHRLKHRRIGEGTLQHAAILTVEFLAGIAREPEKGAVGPDDRVVAPPRIGDHHRRRAGLEGCREDLHRDARGQARSFGKTRHLYANTGMPLSSAAREPESPDAFRSVRPRDSNEPALPPFRAVKHGAPCGPVIVPEPAITVLSTMLALYGAQDSDFARDSQGM